MIVHLLMRATPVGHGLGPELAHSMLMHTLPIICSYGAFLVLLVLLEAASTGERRMPALPLLRQERDAQVGE